MEAVCVSVCVCVRVCILACICVRKKEKKNETVMIPETHSEWRSLPYSHDPEFLFDSRQRAEERFLPKADR